MWYAVNDKVHKSLQTFINENKCTEIHGKLWISHQRAFFTQDSQFHGKYHDCEIVN